MSGLSAASAAAAADSANIRIYVRARPEQQQEAGSQPSWGLGQGRVVSLRSQQAHFAFDGVYGPSSTTAQVYAPVSDIVSRAAEGYNGTIFAYGQTSSGKTHTMTGSPSNPGIVGLALRQLWEHIDDDVAAYKVSITVLEVYNETISQLGTVQPLARPQLSGMVAKPQELQLLADGRGGAQLKGAMPVEVQGVADAAAVINDALERRHVAATEMNAHSSRSHTLVQLRIVRTPGAGQARTSSLLNFVDLAGSESMKFAKTQGNTAREGKNINTSLTTLVRVISALADKEPRAPFRDSKLTRLLEPSLGGNAHTAVIACITLAERHYDQTLSTLHFAQNASRVENCPIKGVIAGMTGTAEQVGSLEQEREQHQKEVRVLTERLGKLRGMNAELVAARDAAVETARQATKEKEDAVQQRREADEQRGVAERALSDCRDTMAKERAVHKEDLAKAQTEAAKAAASAVAANDRATASLKQASSADERAKRAEELEEQHRSRMEQQCTEIGRLESELAAAPVEALEQQRGQIAKLTAEVERLQEESQRLGAAMDDAHGQLRDAGLRVRQRDDKLRAGRVQCEKAATELARCAIKEKVMQKETRLVESRAETESNRLRQALTLKSQLESENAELRRQLKEAQSRMMNLERLQSQGQKRTREVDGSMVTGPKHTGRKVAAGAAPSRLAMGAPAKRHRKDSVEGK